MRMRGLRVARDLHRPPFEPVPLNNTLSEAFRPRSCSRVNIRADRRTLLNPNLCTRAFALEMHADRRRPAQRVQRPCGLAAGGRMELVGGRGVIRRPPTTTAPAASRLP